ncbi:MAG: SsrA-binding protein SmpB [Chitinophagales bacterium]|jgi:SsrA-binding protein|nr:SsrA-binding protein SmpB [Bacteroidota bacterium]MBP8250574.1 SsrA-binding protein SmpB [Chitinophagales bacterium]MBK9504593.1 SsrA-binding protein SmpB [Bacteroidota bacterium]MBK9557361.1 SsrA-binding protein SmpB [Bacteroidota bacterium]MBL0280524.1 SsrA-binding protein SmpB [Bacteroidota bacterium]
MKPAELNIRNKRATFEYEIIDRYVAGIVLRGSEIKSVRDGRASINEAYCMFKEGELWVKNLNISEYKQATVWQHEPLRMRKLLLSKKELGKLLAKVKERGYTIVPLKMFLNERGFAKLEIALARGKKTHDKRNSIKAKDEKRDLDRSLRNYK